ncbi:MAG: hypothetical protein K0R50_944 [Eubacterium sp.]|nr:hypothetical protein [Eubacterium sp.]
MRFFNSVQKNMSFIDIMASIKYFIRLDPDCKYRLAVGTDSQVKGKFTCFATGIYIHREGQGAWGCICKRIQNRQYTNLREKITKETTLTYEMVNMLNQELMTSFDDFIARYENFDCRLEAHIDVGTKGETRKLIKEMVGYFEGMSIDAKIKPEAFVASSYANRFSHDVKVS